MCFHASGPKHGERRPISMKTFVGDCSTLIIGASPVKQITRSLQAHDRVTAEVGTIKLIQLPEYSIPDIFLVFFSYSYGNRSFKLGQAFRNLPLDAINQLLRWSKRKLSPCLTKRHAMKAYWGSGGIDPDIVWPRHQKVSYQLQAPAALPPGKELLVPTG
jgi:hypothetical protein